MSRNFKGKQFDRNRKMKTQPGEDLKYNPPKDSSLPKREYEINPSFQRRAFRDLAYGAFTMKVDPNEEITYQSDPYALLNQVNPIVDAVYPGQDNTSGAIVPQLPNGSTSTFAKVPDSIQMIININYAFCKLVSNSNADKDSNGKGKVNEKMLIPYREILDTINAEAFYDLPFFKWTAAGGFTSDSLLDVLLNYQAVIQFVTSVPLRYRVIRSLEKHLKDMCYENGADNLNSIFGWLKKAAFVNQIKGVSESILYHYLDQYWFQQVAMLVAIPCRKANDMVDPLIDIIPEYEINKSLKVYATSDQTQDPIIDFNAYSEMINAIKDMLDKMSPQYLLSLARNSATTGTDIRTWFNTLSDDTDKIIKGMTQFTKDFADLKVAFKRMSKVGITEWKIGQFVSVDKLEENYSPKFNKLIYDIMRSCFTGSSDISYNTTINKWEHLDLWDKYLGINSYDYKTGGSILTFSTKKADKPTGTPSTVIYPALFYGTEANETTGVPDFKATALTRDQKIYNITRYRGTLNSGAVARTLGRLIPINSQDATTFHVPSVDISTLATEPKYQGWIQNMMLEIFGYERALVADGGNYNYEVAPDAFVFVDVEIDDQSNAITSFVRQHSPFRVIKTNLDMQLGFITKK